MRVPFMDLSRVESEIHDLLTAAIDGVVRKGGFILGPEVESFEREFASYCGTQYGIGVSSGTDALFLALRAVGVGEGDEVVTAANTFIATFNAISCCGATPVPVDVDPDYYCIDPDRLAKAVTSRTRAIMPVHLYGQAADMDGVMRLAKEVGLPVIEDAAQAHGATFEGRKCGSMGFAGCFSFYPAKNLGAFGDGGMVVTNEEGISEKIILARNYGQREKNRHEQIGYNMRLDEIQATVLRIKLERLDADNAARRLTAERYDERLESIPQVIPPACRTGGSAHVYHLYVIRCARRDSLRDYLSRKDIDSGTHYPTPPHLQPAYKGLGYQKGDFPVSERLAGEILSLPMFPGLRREEVDYVCDSIEEFYAAG